MRVGLFGKPLALSLALALIGGIGLSSLPAWAQAVTPSATAPATTPTAPASPPTETPPAPVAPTSPAKAPTPPPSLNEPDQGTPGVPNNATTVTLDVPSRPTAILSGHATWDEGFTAIKKALTQIKAAIDKAGLKQGGAPITVFTETDDNGFGYQAMVPLAEKPAATGQLSDGVTLGTSPAGKAMKFQHRGPYDDIDSTYDLITAYLDEKGLESRDFFIEEYLTPLTSAEDPSLAVDIYVFIK